MGGQYLTTICVLAAVVVVVGGFSRNLMRRQDADHTFAPGHIIGTVNSNHITEASGLAASRKHPGYLYTHNDHGGKSNIYVISLTGHLEATLSLSGVTSNDWEDIAVGKCSSNGSNFCIYVGDFGNGGLGAFNNVYRINEPEIIHDATIHVEPSDVLHFTWDQNDCETLMVDPHANTYIVSKGHNGHGTIAQLPNSAWGSNTRVDISSTVVVNIYSIHQGPVGGDISPDGTEILIKTLECIYYWKIQDTNDYLAVLQTPGLPVSYTEERHGESVCWDVTGNGYYTLSEGHNQPLYKYIRN